MRGGAREAYPLPVLYALSVSYPLSVLYWPEANIFKPAMRGRVPVCTGKNIIGFLPFVAPVSYTHLTLPTTPYV